MDPLDFVMEVQCTYCEPHTKFLYITELLLRIPCVKWPL